MHDATARGTEGAVAENTPGSAPGDASLRGRRILVVDDEEDSLDLMRIVLEGAGASFVGASSASEALAAMGRERIDVVISDIGMPGTDGYVFMHDLRARGADVPAIALTAYARAEDAERALRAGFGLHIAKPVDAQALVTAVERMMRPHPA